MSNPGRERRNVRLVLTARGIRAFGDGFVSILVPVYLTSLGIGAFEVGVLTTAMLLGPAMMTLAIGLIAHRLQTVMLLIGATMLSARPEIIESTFDRVRCGLTTCVGYYMLAVIDIEPIRERFSAVAPFLDERGRRLVAAAEAFAAGYGGITAVAMATGIAPSTIGRGLKELAQDAPSERIRRPGAGRKRTISKDPTLLPDLEALVEPTTRGDPESPLRWTCKSVRRLAQALQAQGHEVSRTMVAPLLNEAGYSLQGNRKTTEGDSHPDRDAQFGYINTQVTTALAEHYFIDTAATKKKELVGDFRNNGREYRPQGNPEEVRVHDFLIKELGRAVPYGVYDLAANSGWVSVGVDHDTAAFAVNSIRQWWRNLGRARYPNATRLLITADGGGSNGSRVRLWKRELQKLANELGPRH